MLRNCPTCGRLLTTPAGTPCPRCQEEDDAAVARIEDHLAQGGQPTMADVSRATGLRLALLRRLVRGGRVVLGDGAAPGVCALCGRPLGAEDGRICPACSRQMQGAAPGTQDGRRTGFYSHQQPRGPILERHPSKTGGLHR